MGVTVPAETVDLDQATTGHDDDALFSEQVGILLGVSSDTLRSMMSKGQGPRALPQRRRDRRGQVRRVWRRADVLAWRDRPRGMRGKAIALHERLAAIDTASRGLRSMVDIGREVGVSGRTVSRHLRGECGCKP